MPQICAAFAAIATACRPQYSSCSCSVRADFGSRSTVICTIVKASPLSVHAYETAEPMPPPKLSSTVRMLPPFRLAMSRKSSWSKGSE